MKLIFGFLMHLISSALNSFHDGCSDAVSFTFLSNLREAQVGVDLFGDPFSKVINQNCLVMGTAINGSCNHV